MVRLSYISDQTLSTIRMITSYNFLTVICCYVFVLSQATPALRTRDPIQIYFQEMWNAWKVAYHKTYKSNENSKFLVWMSNYQEFNEHNHRYSQGKEFYLKVMGQFADLHPEEVREALLPDVLVANFYKNTIAIQLGEESVPEDVNWALQGWTDDSESDKISWRGWAFSVIQSIQAQVFNVTGEYTKFSIQEIKDCVPQIRFRQRLAMDAFYYILKNGACLEGYYPKGTGLNFVACKHDGPYPVRNIRRYELLQPDDEENLKIAVALIGPVSASIRVTGNFFFYHSGVYYDPACRHVVTQTNHAVLIVGYGTDPVAGDFWIIQNSWGSQWGEGGYARMTRNSIINCGIASAVIYPVL